MDLEEAVTVTKLDILGEGRCYVMIGWQTNSFEMYIYTKDHLWKGRFSSNRLLGFSRSLQMTEEEYAKCVRRCLTQGSDSYRYELKGGFFYWKRRKNDSIIIEGFLPIEVVDSATNKIPDLVEVLLSLNKHLKEKANGLMSRFNTIKTDYKKCLKDTEDFLNLKVNMEKSLCTKFINLINMKKDKEAEGGDTHNLKFNKSKSFLHYKPLIS